MSGAAHSKSGPLAGARTSSRPARPSSPQLYKAAGISGAIQHRAGPRTSGTIIAVSKDPGAPVAELAGFGMAGDLFQVVPQLLEEIGEQTGN
jgi:electron transfer flavoprotein alpha subunit